MTSPIDTTALDRFMARTRQAFQARSKDLRMPIEDAQELSAAIGQMMIRVADLQQQLLARSEIITMDLDGGGFDG